MKKAKKTKTTIEVIRWNVTQEYIDGLILMVQSNEFREIITDAGKQAKDQTDNKYILGAQAGFLLAISMTHQIEGEI